ncbi:MAG: hypothetical protein CVV10_05575 [Gammaproteobacteria bacterium HGW-Gammaproteobacteria-14]|nr:MAG: hypothetical protein CVV10_05575 [Gammaproteobacteria bacterium HGW-Gammaproteobacteria-14]
MKRYYYMTRSLASVLGISRDLGAEGIGENRIHVLGKNMGVLERAKVHTTTLWEETDILHFGFLGAMYGMIFGLFGGFVLAATDPWGVDLGSGTAIAATAFGICFGAWLGGIRGISTRNHHIEPYLANVEQEGGYLVMVDADDERQIRSIEKVMKIRHKEAREAGQEDHYSPFF